METVKQVLMRRDNMSADDADEAIAIFKEELDGILDGGGGDPEELVMDHFGLEPDYLLEFIW